MKVLQINAIYKNGSTGRTVWELNNYLTENGIESFTASPKPQGNDDCYLIGDKLDWKKHALFSRVFGLQGYYSKNSTKQLIEHIKRISPDIVHLHNLHGNYINLDELFSYLSKNDIPTVLTLHDCWFYTGKCAHYTMAKCQKWKTGCHNCEKLRTDNRSWFFDRTKKMYNDKKAYYESVPRLAVVGVSDWITNEAKQSVLKCAKVISRVYNWIDLNTFCPSENALKKKAELGLESKYMILGVASIWSDKKGLSTFLELSKHLAEDEKIVLVGNLNAENLPDNIISVPNTDDVKELVDIYSSADVFLQLSLEETFGKVVAEALACGTPIVSVNSTANAELVNDSCGKVVEGNDALEILKAFREIKANGKEFYFENCRKFAQENFSLEKNAQQYVEIYKSISQK